MEGGGGRVLYKGSYQEPHLNIATCRLHCAKVCAISTFVGGWDLGMQLGIDQQAGIFTHLSFVATEVVVFVWQYHKQVT